MNFKVFTANAKPEDYAVAVAVLTGVGLAAWKLGFFDSSSDQTGNTDIDTSNLRGDPTKYANIADDQYQLLDGFFGNSAPIFDALNGLNTDELKAIYKAFGKRKETVVGVPVSASRDLFGFYQDHLPSNAVTALGGKTIDDMKALWAPTGLWN
jgi:hypothetical protein